MVLLDIQHILDSWTPKDIAWERDNVGLQIGSVHQRVRKILVTLDVTDAVINEARRKNVDVIISHHPLIFHPVKAINSNDRVGRLLSELIKSNIALYILHTNLDFTYNGISFSLAERLGLHNVEVLHQHYQIHKKIVVYVPEEYAEKLIAGMSEAGAGIIGKYEYCSFRSKGVGTFKPGQGAKPFIGTIDRLETADEVRLEMIVPTWNLQKVLLAMRAAHPYEEVAYDIYNLANVSKSYGAGAIGELQKPMSLKSFLAHVKRRLRVLVIRYGANPRQRIKRVAVCGGSGSDLLPIAIQRGADAFVTADITYHKFQDSDGNIALIDAEHFETEHPALQRIVKYVQDQCAARKEKIQVFASTVTSNFVQYS